MNCSFRCFIRYNKVFLDSYPYWHHLISRVHLSILPLSHKNAYTVTHPSFLSFPLAGSGEQVVVTFVAFGCSKSHSFFLKRSSHLKKEGGLFSSEALGLSPALSLRTAVCMPLTTACKSPFIRWQPDGVAGIIGRAWWAPFNLSSRVKELVSRSIWAGCNSSQGSRGYVKT